AGDAPKVYTRTTIRSVKEDFFSGLLNNKFLDFPTILLRTGCYLTAATHMVNIAPQPPSIEMGPGFLMNTWTGRTRF
ncbi:MAG: hypothetical protein QF787_17050, partial [Nitrospinota bacterium]|nr:hypothetical protein [Nitrospinota bacterium]